MIEENGYVCSDLLDIYKGALKFEMSEGWNDEVNS